MQTQGISLNVSAMQSLSTGKANKADSSKFDSLLSQNASKSTVKKQNSFEGKVQENKTGSEIKSSSDDFNQHKISLKSGKQSKEEWTEAADLKEIGITIQTGKTVKFDGKTRNGFGIFLSDENARVKDEPEEVEIL